MSERAKQREDDDLPGEGQGEGVSEIEARARSMGWKPKEEYRGPADGWRDAEEFVRRGEEELPIMRERLRSQERRFAGVETQLREATGVIADLTDRFRGAEERAYKKARADLLKQREAAVEVGDTAGFRAAEAELADLDQSAPRPAAPAPAAAPPAVAANAPHPDAVAWNQRNPWFQTNPQMAAMAMHIHQGLLSSEPDLSVRDNLERVTEAVRAAYPNAFPRRERQNDENPRRDEPAAVGGSAPAPGYRRPVPKSFSTMPRESQDAYTRYAKQLEGKGKPLTKEEWAADYYAQFEEG